MTCEQSDFTESIIRSRAQELLTHELLAVRYATDVRFLSVLIVQWCVEIAISLWLPPQSATSSSGFVLAGVWQAVVWGGVIISVPCFLAVQYPGRLLTRVMVAASQALSSSLLIQLMDGRLEMHFHVFASLALLAFYRDLKVLVLFSVLVAGDHLMRGLWWPQSNYGVASDNPLRFAEHMAWIGVEASFLFVFCRQSIAEMAQVTERQARFEFVNNRFEMRVVQRTEPLRRSEERFELALLGTRVGICDWDLKSGRVYWSERINEILGLQSGELPDNIRAVASRLHRDDFRRVVNSLRNAVRNRTSFQGEFRLRSENNGYCWVEASGACVLDEEGFPYRFTGGLTDISHRKQVETELAERDEQLRQSQKLEAIGSLAGGIAHEFNNLLQAIRGYTRYAMKGLLEEESRYQDLQQVMAAAERATSLTRQLLGFSRHEEIDRRELNPVTVLRSVVNMLRPLIGAPIKIITNASGQLGTIFADPGLIQQMLLNLCINARDAMPDGGHIMLTLRRRYFSEKNYKLKSLPKPGPYLLMSVTDNGSGMSPEVQQRIFEPFFTTKEVGVGTGLGLSVVYGIVQQHQGAIDVTSELGFGTTFNVYLPINLVSIPDLTPQELPRSRGGTESILLVEDEACVRELGTRILTGAGYRVLTANDGVAALRMHQRHQDEISLVLLDAILPRLSGHRVLEELRARNPAMPFVFCTGYDPDSDSLGFAKEDGVRLVQKPFEADTLLRTIRESLDLQHLKVEMV